MSTLEVNTINPQSGNDVTIGGSSKNVKFASGTTVDFSTNTPTLTLGATMKNTPAFEARLSSAHSVSTATWTKINVNTEVYDTDSTYDNSSNYRWTPGVAGKYVIYGQAGFDAISDGKILYVAIYKNGSQLWTDGTAINHTGSTAGCATRGTWSIDLDADDYVELFAYHNHGSDRNTTTGWCYFGGYKIVE